MKDMNTKIYPSITIDEEPKKKNWKIPPGVYRAVLVNSERDQEGSDILRFNVTNYTDSYSEYWVRNRYRKKDLPNLHKDIIIWRGIQEFATLQSGDCLVLDSLYGQEADIEVECLKKHPNKEALRVIKAITPPGSLVPDAKIPGKSIL
jgi:hypothetical protein